LRKRGHKIESGARGLEGKGGIEGGRRMELEQDPEPDARGEDEDRGRPEKSRVGLGGKDKINVKGSLYKQTLKFELIFKLNGVWNEVGGRRTPEMLALFPRV
jgi:hypothetical protein